MSRGYRLPLLLILGCLSLPAAAGAATGSLSFQGCVAESGADGCATGTGLSNQHGTVVAPDGTSVYTIGRPGQIAAFARDTATGALTSRGCIAEGGADGCTSGTGLNGASGVAISPDGTNVYVVSATTESIAEFSRSSTGALTEIGCRAVGSADGCGAGTKLNGATGVAVSPDGANVYVTSETDNALVTFTRAGSTGLLSEAGCVTEGAAAGCTTGHGLNHAENVTVSPDGADVYATAYDSGAVVHFSRSGSTGALAEQECRSTPAADGCTAATALKGADGIAASPDGADVYVAAETSGALTHFGRGGGGALTEQGCVAESGGTGCGATTAGLTGAARVAVSPDGASVYTGGYLGNTLVTFARGSGGSVAAQGCVGESGNGDGCAAVPGLTAPAGLAVSPDGSSLYTGAKSALDTFARTVPPTPPQPPAGSSPAGGSTGPPTVIVPPPPLPPQQQQVRAAASFFKFLPPRIGKLLRSGFATEVAVTVGGTLTQEMWTVPHRHHQKPMLLGRATATARGAGIVRLTLRVNGHGRSVLRSLGSERVSIVTAERATAGTVVRLPTKTVTLRR